jgi:hypothetical protein
LVICAGGVSRGLRIAGMQRSRDCSSQVMFMTARSRCGRAFFMSHLVSHRMSQPASAAALLALNLL